MKILDYDKFNLEWFEIILYDDLSIEGPLRVYKCGLKIAFDDQPQITQHCVYPKSLTQPGLCAIEYEVLESDSVERKGSVHVLTDCTQEEALEFALTNYPDMFL